MQTTTRTRRRFRSRLLAAAVAAAFGALAALAAAPADAAGLLVADGGLGGVLEIEEHDVAVTVNNGIAVTEVTQVFRNTEDRQLEALYTFPVPKGASVSEFSMWIGGREMIGEVVEKQRARQIYDSYKRQNIDPGLLEQVDHKTFEMRIFPVLARAEQRVRIVYYQELDVDADWATYVYPLATKAGGGIDSRTQGRMSLRFTARSEVPIVEVDSPSHGDEFVIVKEAPEQVQASLEVTGGDLNRDFVLAFRTERAQTGLDLVASKERGDDGYFLMTLTAGDELAEADTGMDYVFVLDISGSMADDGKLGMSRGSIDAFVRALGPEDRFDVMTFNVTANPLFRQLRPAEEGPKNAAESFLLGQRARGGTVLEPALRAAYRYKDPDRSLNVVLLSDGMTEAGERDMLLRLIGERPASTRVFAIGVGNEVNRPLLQQLAEDAGGLAAFISRGDDFERQAAAFRRKLMRPAITNLEITADGGELFDVEPRKLPNLYHGMPVRLYGRYGKSGKVTLHVRGDLEGGPFERELEIELPGNGADNPEIERMWACHRVVRLMREVDAGGETQPGVAEIVRLGEGYSIVTPYTSFLVLENDDEYRRWKIERRNVTRTARDRAARERVNAKIRDLRTAAAEGLGPAGAEQARAPRGSSDDRPAQAPTQSTRGVDLNLGGNGQGDRWSRRRSSNSGGGFGGGAIDPFGVVLVVSLGGAAWAARRRRRDGEA
jgi:Ca-activated chloride channel family protein